MIQKEEEDTSEIKTISSHFKLKSTTSNKSTDRETVAELQAKQSFYKKATDCLTDLIDFINYKGPKSDWNSVFDDPFLCINVPADFVPRIREVGLPIFKSSKDVDAEASAARFRIYELQGVISLTLDQSSEKTTIKLVDRFVNAMESLQELKEHYMIKATKLASLVHGEEKKKVKLAMYKKNSSKFAFSEEDIQKKVMRNQNLLSSSEQSKQKALKKHQDLEHIETSIRSLFEKAQPLKNYGMYKELVDEEEDIDEDE
ncbi:MAG: hypothetical protein F9K49_07295 [Caedimonadaceae bacterium]|nr:MAG: hypothetical protein F9K49_07295 [Caedimonadaceae bacterium]